MFDRVLNTPLLAFSMDIYVHSFSQCAKICCTLRSVKENKEGISFGRAPCMHMICYFTSDSFPIVKNYDFSQMKIQETF